MDKDLLNRLIGAVGETIVAHADELTALDQAIGDGDHGLNMRRGFEAVLAERATLSAMALPDALKAVGTTLVMKVGGASGPLYGTLFMSLGKALSTGGTLDAPNLGRALGEAIDAVKLRGKSEPGQKTMLDVLVPLQGALAAGEPLAKLPAIAAAAAAATIPLLAIRGRASFLGERSRGHMDPGARSAALIVAALCGALHA